MDPTNVPVLIVEDEATSRLFVKKILQRIGFQTIHEAHDGSEALEVLATVAVNFVICDLHMRPLDGFSFTTKLRRSKNERLRELPIIMLTSEKSMQAYKLSEDLKIAAYVVKPTSRYELQSAIESALNVKMYGGGASSDC